MALIPEFKYPGQTLVGSAAYPYGSARNVEVAGDGTGFPLEKDWVNDVLGMLQSLLADAGVTPNRDADSVTNPQYLTALKAIILAHAAANLDGSATFLGNTFAWAGFHTFGVGASLSSLTVTSGGATQFSGAVSITHATNEVIYSAPRTRTLTRAFRGVGPGDATQLESGPFGDGSVYMRRVGGSILAPTWQEPLDLPIGATITGWKTLATTDTSSVGVGTLTVGLYKRTVDFVTPAVGSATLVGTTGAHAGANALTAVSKVGLSEVVAAGTEYFLYILEAGSSGSDLYFRLHGYEVTLTETRATGHY